MSMILETGRIFLPSRIASGDHIEMVPISDTHMGVLLFDVVGKGIDAGISRNAILKLFKTAFDASYSPSTVINRVHQQLCNDDALQTYATVFYGVIDTRFQTLTYINAGHDPIIHIHNKNFLTLDASYMQIGADSTHIYTEITVPYVLNDKLILYSDGVPDARNVHNEPFGFERLKDLIVQHQNMQITDLVQVLHKSVMAFSFGKEQKDDVSIVVIGNKMTSDDNFLLEKTASIATLNLDEGIRHTIQNLLEPALKVKPFGSTQQLLDHLKHNPDDIIVVFAGQHIKVEEIASLCTHSKLLEVIVISDNGDSDWCKHVMKAGARHIAKPSNDIAYLKTLITDSVKRVDALRRSLLTAHHSVSDWVSFTTEVLQCCQKSNIPLSRHELASVCKWVYSDISISEPATKEFRKSSSVSPVILTIEDDSHVRQRIAYSLAMEGYTFYEAHDLQSALEQIKSHEIDCCLLDIGLPDGSGLDLIPKLKAVNPDIEIIMVTAYNNFESIIPAFQFGVLDYIVKPIQNETLMQKIEEASKRNFMNRLSKQPATIPELSVMDIPLRLRILEQFIIHRLRHNQLVYYKNLYQFFPEIQRTHPSDEVVPSDILKIDMNRFMIHFVSGQKYQKQ